MTNGFNKILRDFIIQANTENLKVSAYPKEFGNFRMKVSFGQGAPARIPWIAFIAPDMQVSRGFYPVYLYYKAQQTLILAYGVSETESYGESWPVEVQNDSNTIKAFFGVDMPRYNDSFVFKAYKLSFAKHSDSFSLTYGKEDLLAGEKEIEIDLETILDYYTKAVSREAQKETSPISQGLFYMEKQLEDFIIQNWDNTELGKKYDLIIEDGELVSQQYRTDIGPIDILARDKKNGNHVVIELKRNQTSDDTVGQAMRYMGWVKEKLGDKDVKAVIIVGTYDQKLDFALKMAQNIEVFIYEVSFKLGKFSSSR